MLTTWRPRPEIMVASTLPRGARRVLISTISPESGGVPANLRFVTSTLRGRGYEPVLAHYEPYSISPHLSVPSFRLFQRRVGNELRHALDGFETHAIGAWLPELEFTHYLATEAWQRVMDSCSAYLAVAGNALASIPYFQTGRPFVGWISSGWHSDRRDRVKEFPLRRKVVDSAIVKPVVSLLERSLLKRGSVLAASNYTQRLLDEIAGRPVVRAVLPVPIDTDFFSPAPNRSIEGRIGFSGRLSDPRKNLELLIRALGHLRQTGHGFSALLIGGEPDEKVRRLIDDLGLGDVVEFTGYVSMETLREKLRTLDLFVVPSHQEGLCISALEAMACGCPVVSTRCGGPEEFVLDDETGFLVEADPGEMADTMARILSNAKLQRRLGAAAREKVMRDYSVERANTIFWLAFNEQFARQGDEAAH
jgi:glycosyltransferase involved in cell wall biosynthesis